MADLVLPPTPDLSGRVALVTGASRGIGFQLALQLARCGAHVVAVARTMGGLEELDDMIKTEGGSATLIPLDLKDMAGVDRIGAAIHERWGKLDVLVANAGVLGVIGPLGHIEAKRFDEVMAVNVTSQWRLMRTVDPLLRASDAGRAILMSSGAAHSAKAYWGPYAASKAALEALGRSWAHELENTNVKVNMVNPGAVRTAMRALAMPGEDPSTLPSAASVAQAILPLASPELTVSRAILDVPKGVFTRYCAPA